MTNVELPIESTNTGNKFMSSSAQLPQVCTVFQAELLGIKIACEQLLNEFDTYRPRDIKIFSDSQAAILALDSSEMTSLHVKETKNTLNTLATKVQRISVVWIKAQVGHEGNEEADRLAKIGTTKNENQINVGTLQAEIKSEINKSTQCKWDKKWQTYSKAKHTKEL